MADSEVTDVPHPGEFSLSWSGGLEYGSRDMVFDGESKFYFAKGDTINSDKHTGIGVFALSLKNADLEELKVVAQQLCDKDIQSGGPETVDPSSTFGVVCIDNEGKAVRRSGSTRLIPERFNRVIFDVPYELAERAWNEGSKIIKLDFETVSIVRKDTHYIVSVRFINSGNRWIRFKTPDQWSGGPAGGELGVAPFSKLGQMDPRDDWGFGLSGAKLINRSEFPDGFITLNPGETRLLKFEALPDNKISRGEYSMSGAAFMRIEYEGYGWGLATNVDFRPIRTRITFDHDYPSTPQERERWEKTHRENMSQWPVKPGATFAEDGLYRAIRTSGGYRGLLLKPFKAGDVATTEPVTMPMESPYADDYIQGPVQWLWEASAPTPVKQWSLDLIDGTQHDCEPGAVCPRNGRWVPRVMSGVDYVSMEYEYRPAGIATLRRGDPMPPIRGRHAAWEWVGSAT